MRFPSTYGKRNITQCGGGNRKGCRERKVIGIVEEEQKDREGPSPE
jgi:hypothetical protein